MYNRRNNTLKHMGVDLTKYFLYPATQRQKQYEATRAIIIEKKSIESVAENFRYKKNTIYSLIRDAKAGKINLFPDVRKGPAKKQTHPDTQKKVIEFRKQGFSTTDIHCRLEESGINISARTAERILKDAGYGKLKRRNNKELGKTTKNKIIPFKAEILDFSELEPFNVDCPSAGVFFFIPYIIESGILNIIKECELPESSVIGSTQACLSILLLKLIGGKRMSHVEQLKKLSQKLNGHYNYFGITGNSRCLGLLFHRVRQIWRYWLNKRRRENEMPWERFLNLEKHLKLPFPRAKHSVCVANL